MSEVPTVNDERCRSLVDQAPDAIIIVDADRGLFVEEANPSAERLYELPRQQILGQYGPVDLSPEFQPNGRRSDQAAFAYIQRALDGELPSFEWTHYTSKGKEMVCQVTLSRFPDPDRNLVRASIIDLTERKRQEAALIELEAQLHQAQKLEAIGQLTGGLAHDFNNLLSVIICNLELLALGLDEDHEGHSLIRSALSATEQGSNLTRSMLNFASRAPLRPQPIRLSDVVQHMGDLISRTIPATISIETTHDDQPWLVHADRSGTESALLNLVLNACDAMPDGGELHVGVERVSAEQAQEIAGLPPRHHVKLSVSDNGRGIPHTARERIFEPFFSTKTSASGSGLGLSMVHGFMTQTGGGVRVSSTVDVGTTIDLYFPASVADEDTNRVRGSIPAQQDQSTPRMRILVAEDQHEMLGVLQKMLEQQGHEVFATSSGVAALEVFEATQGLDLVITDAVMPGPTQGLDLVEHIRRADTEIPTIVMSGYANEWVNTEHIAVDVELAKPITSAALAEAIHTAIARKPQRRLR